MSQPAFRRFMKVWYDPAVLPIVAVVGGASVGAGWYLARLARGPDVTWDRRGNPEPWNTVQPGESTKLWTSEGKPKWERKQW